MTPTTRPLPLRDAAEAARPLGWRLVLGGLRTQVAVRSLGEALAVAQIAHDACGAEAADARLTVLPAPDACGLALAHRGPARASRADLELAAEIADRLGAAGFRLEPVGERRGPGAPPATAQALEIAIDALDIPRIRPFWQAVLGYVPSGDDALCDPAGIGPDLWFQQMDAPRPQRNRIHFDVSVPEDAARDRIRAALDAGGTLVSDAAARAFWILADAEGNECCVCTWQDRDKAAAPSGA